jgi:hypothetical protein
LAAPPGGSASGGFQSPGKRRRTRDDAPDGPSPSPPPPDKSGCAPFEIEGSAEGDSDQRGAESGGRRPRAKKRPQLTYTLPKKAVTLKATSADKKSQLDSSKLHWEYKSKPFESKLRDDDLQDGASVKVTPDVPGTYELSASCGDFSSVYTIYAIGIRTTTFLSAPGSRDAGRTKIGVGEVVRLTLIPSDVPGLTARWDLVGGAAAGHLTDADGATTLAFHTKPFSAIGFRAPPRAPGDAGVTATIEATFRKLKLQVKFTVVEPSGVTPLAHSDGWNPDWDSRWAGQGTRYTLRLDPDDVSFQNLWVKEYREGVAAKEGYFARPNHIPTEHEPLAPVQIDEKNTVIGGDECYFYEQDGPWEYGTFTWQIRFGWHVNLPGEQRWNQLKRNTQVSTIENDKGGAYITKFGMRTGTRSPT